MIRLAALVLARLRLAVLAALEVHDEPLPDLIALVRAELRQQTITALVDDSVSVYDWESDWAEDRAFWEASA